MQPNYILGLSCFYHDSAACLLKDGVVIAAAQEERFTRKKHDSEFPKRAVQYCLNEAGITVDQLSYVAYYEKPFIKFDRILMTHLCSAPRGLLSFLKSMPVWLRQKLWISSIIKKELQFQGKIIYPEHHEAHAASTFFCSPFQSAAIMTLDGVGEWSTATCGWGENNKINLTHEIRFPHSLGLLYSAFTGFLGFKVNSGEYKVMGLAPYGNPTYYNLIMDNLIDVKADGSFQLNLKYFSFVHGLKMTGRKFEKLLGRKKRSKENRLTQDDFDVAASIQKVTEDIVLKIAKHLKIKTGMKNLCLAGGVALNCVANGRILREAGFDDIYIQPAAGDAGGALGAAAFAYYSVLNNERSLPVMKMPYVGPEYSESEIRKALDERGAVYQYYPTDELLKKTAVLLCEQNVVGWFQGRMEFGPRALGGRSILADPRDSKMKDKVNLKIKFRESFRPFAPTVLEEHVNEYFELDRASPYMLLVAQVRENKRIIPAITHVDGSARIQTISKEDHPLYYNLIKEFHELSGIPVLINTSFNVRGEPIVGSPRDAYNCLMGTNMDYLVIGNYILDKKEQKDSQEFKNWHETFPLD